MSKIINQEFNPLLSDFLAELSSMTELKPPVVEAFSEAVTNVLQRKKLLYLVDASDKTCVVLKIRGFEVDEQASLVEILITAQSGGAA